MTNTWQFKDEDHMIRRFGERYEDIHFIKSFFREQMQRAGSLFLWEHGLQAAIYLAETIDTVQEISDDIKLKLFQAALGHDLLEDTHCTSDDLLKQWSHDVSSFIQALTNVKGDDDVKEYTERLKYVDEAVLIIKLADIYVNVANTVREFKGIDVNWLGSFWLPLLDKYEKNLFGRTPIKYQRTIKKMIDDISEKKKQLVALYEKASPGK